MTATTAALEMIPIAPEVFWGPMAKRRLGRKEADSSRTAPIATPAAPQQRCRPIVKAIGPKLQRSSLHGRGRMA